MATGTSETLDDRLKKVTNDLEGVYLSTFEETEGDEDGKLACWDIHDQLKPSKLFPSKFLKINFQIGTEEPQKLQDQLEKAVSERRKLTDLAKTKIRKFVDHITEEKNKRMDGLESAKEALESVGAQHYIGRILMELETAGQIKWDTRDGNAVKEETKFWTLPYRQRKQFEASQLHACIRPWHVPRTGDSKKLLPVMYWLEQSQKGNGQTSTEQEGSTTVWVEYIVGTYDKSSKKKTPPSWATDYIDRMENVLKEKLQKFVPEEKPNERPNAVYLLLCRFNREGVPEDSKVQAYAGKATNGVEERWLQHADKSQSLIKTYNESKTFNETPLKLGSSLLVEVIIGRLYAQGGRRYLTENDTVEHDNIALFVYRAYGANKTGDLSGKKCMEEKEKELIRQLELRDMKYGMNARL